MEIFVYQNIKEYDFQLQYTALNKIYKDIFVYYGIVQFQCESVPHLNLAKVLLPYNKTNGLLLMMADNLCS